METLLPDELLQALVVAAAAFIGAISKDIRGALARWFTHKGDEAESDLLQDGHIRDMNIQHLELIERLIDNNAKDRASEHQSLQAMMGELMRLQRECQSAIIQVKQMLE